MCEEHGVDFLPEWGSGKLIFELYDTILLPTVVDPVFVCGFPVEVSPLARRTADDPTMADRFELAIDAKEFANGYSELNIPEEQQERFRGEAEAVAQGDLEAHPADHGLRPGPRVRACRPPRASASASTGWSCCWPRWRPSATSSCSR